MKRSIEQWQGCNPVAMALQSHAAIFYAFEDAKEDIIELAAERDKLKEINVELLEALKDIVTYWDSIVPTDCINEMHIKARAAIAKCE